MKNNKNTTTVYWSPSILPNQESWSFYYRDPYPVMSGLRKIQNKNAKTNFFSCPSVTNLFSNIYRIDCPISFNVKLDKNEIELHNDSFNHIENNNTLISADAPISIFSHRKSILDGYMTCLLNMKWMFFAEEPLTIRITPPYFPSVVPAPGALLASGEYDIGSWYRPIVIDYHFPLNTNELVFNEGDPLLFIEFKTDKKIVFKRYHMTEKLWQMKNECLDSPRRYGRFKTLKERYAMASKANFSNLVLNEIKNNLVDER